MAKKTSTFPVANTTNLPGTEIILKLVQEFQDRARKNIDKWRQAILAAENPEDPRWFLLQDMIDEIEIDGHVGSVVEIRFSSTLNHPFYVYDRKTKQTLQEQTDFLQEQWFFNYMECALSAIKNKYSLMQFYSDGNQLNFYNIPRRNVCYQKKRVYLEVSGDKYIDYSMLDDVIEIVHSSKFGIMNDVIPNIIWKRNLIQSNAEFSEKYGMPLITAVTSNKAEVPRIDKALKNLGEAGTGVLPKGTEIQVHPLANAGNPEKVYLDPAEFHDKQISKRFLGSTTITDEGANRAQTQVHRETLDEVLAKKDRRMIVFETNNKLFPLLKHFGFPFDNSSMSFAFDENESLTLEQQWKITSDALRYYDLDDKEIAKRFNLPIIGRKSTASDSNEAAIVQNKIPVYKNQTKGEKYPFEPAVAMRAIAAACGATLPEYDMKHFPIAEANELSEDLLNELRQFDEAINDNLYRNNLSEAQRNRLLKSKRIAEELRDGLFNGFGKNRRIKIEWNAPDNRALAAMEMNLFRFAESKSLAEVLMLNQLLIDKEKLEIRSENDFIQQAKKINVAFNENYLRTERDFAIATGQTSARWFEFMAEKGDIPYWQYQTVGDDQVRPTHAMLDGRIFAFDDTEARRLYPPNDYGCRCEGIQYAHKTDNVENGKNWIESVFPNEKIRSNFAVNRAEAGIVFTQNQMYVNQLTGKNKKLNEYSFLDYGLKKWNEFKDTLKPLQTDNTINETNVKELFKNNASTKDFKAMGFEDYLKRKLIMKEKTFLQHIEGKYIKPKENRHRLFPFIKEALNSPDEVWMNQYQTGNMQLRYIKFYNNNIFVVDTEINNDALEVKTWYIAKIDEEKLRTGLIIK